MGGLLNKHWNLSFHVCSFVKSRHPLDGSKQGKTVPHNTQLLVKINGGFTFFTSKSHSPAESFIWRPLERAMEPQFLGPCHSCAQFKHCFWRSVAWRASSFRVSEQSWMAILEEMLHESPGPVKWPSKFYHEIICEWPPAWRRVGGTSLCKRSS